MFEPYSKCVGKRKIVTIIMRDSVPLLYNIVKYIIERGNSKATRPGINITSNQITYIKNFPPHFNPRKKVIRNRNPPIHYPCSRRITYISVLFPLRHLRILVPL